MRRVQFTATGESLADCEKTATQAFKTYFGEVDFAIIRSEGRPFAEKFGLKIPELWQVEFEAEGEE